jgi:hypothetical protein
MLAAGIDDEQKKRGGRADIARLIGSKLPPSPESESD